MIERPPLIVIGASAGGLTALKKVLSPLPEDFSAIILVVQHQLPDKASNLDKILRNHLQLPLAFAQNGFPVKAGNIYLAPPDYHLRLNKEGLMMLSQDDKVNFSRPSIDVLFTSVAKLKQFSITTVILTGANSDGADGARAIQDAGGKVIVQHPESAEVATMPQAVLDLIHPDKVIWLDQIAGYLWDSLHEQN